MKLSTTLTTNILKALCGNEGSTQNPNSTVQIGKYENCWLGLFNGEPTNGGTELSGHGYKRTEIHNFMDKEYQSYALGETQNTDHPRRIGNKSQISFQEAICSDILVDAEHGGRWNTATHWAMFTQESKGTAIAWGELEEPITVDTHQVFIIRRGHLELYMEPDTEYIYYGAFASETDFVNAIRAKENGENPGGLERVEGTERKRTIPGLDVTNKFLFFAYPVDFKGLPVFRGDGEPDEYGDIQYQEYAAQRMSNAPICKSYYVTTTTEGGETVVMADRNNAYYVYRVYGQKDKYVPCGQSQPSDWATNWKLYYTHYVPITSKTAPEFAPDTFYSYSDGAYTVLNAEPANWSTNWKDYYTYNAMVYTPVKDATAPTYRAGTYFALEGLTGPITFDVF